MEAERTACLERNLRVLEALDPDAASRLSRALRRGERKNLYTFAGSRSAHIVPALKDPAGKERPLHSMVDPRREGERLISTLKGEGFLVFLGLGGGFAPAAALEREGIIRILIVEYDSAGTAELLAAGDYTGLLGDPRVTLLLDPSPGEIENFILDNYQPVLSGGIRVFPLRPRTDREARFAQAGEAMNRALDRVSADYSVQAHFGKRWFLNIIRNLAGAEKTEPPVEPIQKAAVCGAGPSLDEQLPLLREKQGKTYIIAADTAFPALLRGGIEPDAVISIDCQHISWYHFAGALPPATALFLDLAGPPLVASRSPAPRFFSGGHPLTAYISRNWRPFPLLDTSGANVTYAAAALAESLGAESIELYGADFSYPLGRVYARGTYIFPFFERRQNRLNSLEALLSRFLYRSPLEKHRGEHGDRWYYETRILAMYRNRLEARAARMEAEVLPITGGGAPVRILRQPGKRAAGKPPPENFAPGAASSGAGEFLRQYRKAVARLPLPGTKVFNWLTSLDGEERTILSTLLPLGAALKRREAEAGIPRLIEALRDQALYELDRVSGI
jgi:hypothetical protein